MPLNMTATSCHFGLLSRARRTPDLRMCELHCGLLRLGRIDVMISTRASVKTRVPSLDVDLVWHWPCTNFGSELWILHYRCCPTTLSGKAPDLATRSALMLPLPLRPPLPSSSLLPSPSSAPITAQWTDAVLERMRRGSSPSSVATLGAPVPRACGSCTTS